MTDAPCKNCETRSMKCHATCEKYADFKIKREEEKKGMAEYKAKNEWFVPKLIAGMTREEYERRKRKRSKGYR